MEKFAMSAEEFLAARKALQAQMGFPEDLWDIVDHFSLYIGVQTLETRLATFEILKRCVDVPGHILELGCWKSAGLLFLAKALQILQPNTHKHVYGFDAFEGLRTFSPHNRTDVVSPRNHVTTRIRPNIQSCALR